LASKVSRKAAASETQLGSCTARAPVSNKRRGRAIGDAVGAHLLNLARDCAPRVVAGVEAVDRRVAAEQPDESSEWQTPDEAPGDVERPPDWPVVVAAWPVASVRRAATFWVVERVQGE
jgi:hypothetical protein